MLLVVVLAFSLIMQPSAANIQTRQKPFMGPYSSEGFQVASNTECVASEPVSFSRLLRLDALGSASAVLDNGDGSDQFCATLRDVLNDAFGASCEDDEEMKFPKTVEALEIVPSSSNIIRSNVRGGQDYFSFHLNLNVTCDGAGCTEDSDLFIPTSGPDRCDQVSKSFRCRAKENQNGLDLMPCECPIPKEFHLLDALNEAIKSGPLNEHMDSVVDMLELEIVPACEGLPEKNTFVTTIEIQVSHPGDSLRFEDTEFLNSNFEDLYNDMNTRDDNFCDPEARQIDSIAVARTELKVIGGDFNTTNLWLRVSGTCYGCDPVSTHLFEYGNQETTRKLSEAALVDAECFCPRNVPLQGPSKADFAARFQNRVDILSDSALSIAGTNEVQSFPCPTTSDQISVSTIVELQVPDKTAAEITLESQDFSSFEAAFARSYNMATEEYCDLLFRRVDVAEVSRVVPVSNDTVAVQVDLQGSCQGCSGPDTSSIFDTYTNFESHDILGASRHRSLQNEQCFCPLDSPNRAIAEEEYIGVLQQAVLGEPSRGRIEAVQPCYLKESFENAILVTSKSSVDLSGYETYLADSFKSAANRNLGTDGICDPKFREVIDVTAQVGSFDSIQFSESPTLSPTFFPSAVPSSIPSFNILLNETASPESDVPSFSPSASPTFEPTPLLESFTQYIAFFFTGTCRGCQGDNYLGNDQIFGRRMAQEERRAQETGPASSSCYCPLDAIRVQETALTLLEALQEEINENSNIPEGTIVDSMTEIAPVSCEPSTNTFKSNIVKIDISVIGELDVDTILLIAASTYNEMNQESYCDPWFRQIFDANLIGTFSPLGLSQVEDESSAACQDYTIEVSFQGECRGCSDGVSILETKTEPSRKLESQAGFARGTLALRALEETNPEKCFCSYNAVADRAPSYDEFKQRLQENILSVSNLEKMVCEVKEVSGDDASLSPSTRGEESEQPSVILALSSNPAAFVSTAPSQYRSHIPSDMPSTLPSSVPSISMVPSMSPSTNPSASVYPSELPSSSPTSCIAESACNPQKACQRSENLCAGPDSCSGKNSCRATLNADIESNSCIGKSSVTLVSLHLDYKFSLTPYIFHLSGQSACQSLTGIVGDNSCQGASACALSTVKNQLIIGDNSCLGLESCFQIKSSTNRKNRDKDTVIGDGSCKAPGACSNFQGVSIGSNSCNCEECCSCFATGELPDEVPSDSCNVRGECCSTDAPSMVPSSQPSEMPSTSLPVFDLPLSECKTVGSTTFIAACLSGPDLLADANSPQSQALQWILDSPEVDNWDGLELSQRYVVGVFLAGDNDLQSFGNQNTAICGTPNLSCNAEGEIIDFDFTNEEIAGTLPREIGALTALQTLDIAGESWCTGVDALTGPIPSEIGLLTQLKYLYMYDNYLTGTIPTELGRLTASAIFNLSGNQLTGTLPTQLGELTAVSYLYLQYNQLTGTIPLTLTQLANLKELSLNVNNLTGQVPSGFCAAPFPDWRADGQSVFGNTFVTDCIDEVQCDCCDICSDSGGTRYCWDGSGFIAC